MWFTDHIFSEVLKTKKESCNKKCVLQILFKSFRVGGGGQGWCSHSEMLEWTWGWHKSNSDSCIMDSAEKWNNCIILWFFHLSAQQNTFYFALFSQLPLFPIHSAWLRLLHWGWGGHGAGTGLAPSSGHLSGEHSSHRTFNNKLKWDTHSIHQEHKPFKRSLLG